MNEITARYAASPVRFVALIVFSVILAIWLMHGTSYVAQHGLVKRGHLYWTPGFGSALLGFCSLSFWILATGLTYALLKTNIKKLYVTLDQQMMTWPRGVFRAGENEVKVSEIVAVGKVKIGHATFIKIDTSVKPYFLPAAYVGNSRKFDEIYQSLVEVVRGSKEESGRDRA